VTTPTGSIKVIVAATGKTAYLPAAHTEIRPGYAIIPQYLKRRILNQQRRYDIENKRHTDYE
jgi:hypothetical protein